MPEPSGRLVRPADDPSPGFSAASPTRDPSPPEPAAPRYSVVIPIHNEADCLESEVAELVREMDEKGIDYELILAENGSSDATPEIAERLAAANPRIRALRVPIPDYGYAMKTGMLTGRGDYVVNFDIDFHDVSFMLAAGELLADGAGIVVGSKLMEGAEDKRSPMRHFISYGFTTVLRVLFDPHMDDTHGMKALRHEVVQAYAPQTVMRQDIFDTELIIRARRGGVRVAAIPVTVEEKRKARSSIVRRIPRTVRALLRLRLILWKERNAGS
jgi:glycosyltransferase involved in cell wall biosynthesis